MRNLNIILSKINVKSSELFAMNKCELKRQFEKINFDADWRVNFMLELLEIRDNQLECGLDRNKADALLKYVSIFR